MADPFIRLINLSKAFQEGNKSRQVLKNTNITFQEGEFSAILGRSGSGKSTLLNLISGIDDADNGEIWIKGINLNSLNEHERTLFRRKNIGFIFQFFNLLPTLTVLENVTLPLELAGATQKKAKDTAIPLLEMVELADRQNTFPDRLSGGEQQRVAIARALVHNPLLVLADEPIGNLDINTGISILSLLDKLTRQAGKNLIMVTHSQSSASYADNRYRLQNGHLSPETI